MNDRILISFFGASGSGKSTCYYFAERYLQERGYIVYHLNVATPLRQIQSHAYKIFGREYFEPLSPDFKQDGQLLGFLAKHFESELGPTFKKTLEEILDKISDEKIAIINTDCRNNAYETLRNSGFTFVRLNVSADILTKRRLGRGDVTPFNHDASVEQYNEIIESFSIDNNGDLENLRTNILSVLDHFLS